MKKPVLTTDSPETHRSEAEETLRYIDTVLTQHYGHIVSIGKVLEDLESAQAENEKLRECAMIFSGKVGKKISAVVESDLAQECAWFFGTNEATYCGS